MNKKTLSFLLFLLTSFNVQAQLIDSGVIVQDLPSFSLNSLGSSNSFSPNIWQESDKETLLSLITQIGTTSLTPASKKALVFLLTQDSTGYKKTGEEAENDETFLTERLKALVRLGAFEETLHLINQIPEKQVSEEIQKIKFYTLLLQGKTQEAEGILDTISNTLFLDKARINLFLEKEEKNKAILSYEIYKETSENPSDLFSSCGENVLLELETPLVQNKATAEDVFLLSRLKETSFDFELQDIGIQKVLSELPYTPIERRIFLAEKAGLNKEEMLKIYSLPLHDIKIEKNHLLRAQLFQKLQTETSEVKKTKLINEFVELAKQDKLILSLSPIVEHELNKILPQPAHLSLAFNAAQIYALQNNLEKANEWYQLLKDSPSDKHQKQRMLLIPFLQVLGAGISNDLNSLIKHFCGNLVDNECAQFYQRLSSEAYEEIVIPKKENLFVPYAYLNEENKSKTGENLIRAILDLNNKNTKDKTLLYDFISNSAPKQIEKPFQLERMFYQ
ncbi:MAG: hypothetical protein IJY92_05245 [Alphaproteobacteria bacterium]|nr:hypothetical protein [Alphaproteobacteria bacterium]